MQSILFSSLLFFCCIAVATAEVTVREIDGGFDVRIAGKPFTTYRYKGLDKPCFYPVIGPDGIAMTRRFPLETAGLGEEVDHPHHTSLWYAHGDVNGLDFWAGGGRNPAKGGRIVHDSVVKMTDGRDQAVLVTKSKWLAKADDKEILRDERRMSFGEFAGARYIDFQITLEATNGKVTFGDTKEGTMAIRTHPNLRLEGKVANGKAVNSAGDHDKELWGKAASWVDYWGQVDGKAVGVAVFDHPKNPRHPTTWHAREYGLIAANPFGYSSFFKGQGRKGALTIEDGKSVTFRYRFLFHPGGHDADKIKKAFESFADSAAAR